MKGRLSRRVLSEHGARGFTLVEILIVVVILGILAAIVVPQLSNASQSSREVTLKDTLRFMRSQIEVFKAQHRDVPPGHPGGNIGTAPLESALLDHMLKYTDEFCGVSDVQTASAHFGPYLSKMPPNPINGLVSVKMVANGSPLPSPDDTTGWIYKSDTGEFMANMTGADHDGNQFSSY